MMMTATQRFWLLTFGLLATWTFVIVSADDGNTDDNKLSAAPYDSPEKEHQNTLNCKALCGHCGCLGFYCGEECICECNKENSDTECITAMQETARKLAIPFELLIQGPTANRFVRQALHYEQNAERKSELLSEKSGRNKRSTVVIYKPAAQNSLNAQSLEEKPAKADKVPAGARNKRSVKHLDWFSDLTNNLVRPAPLKRVAEEHAQTEDDDVSSVQHKRSADDFDRSWFADNASKLLLRPAPLIPLFKRRNGGSSISKTSETSGATFERHHNQEHYQQRDLDLDSGELFSGLPVMDKIPKVLKGTLRTIQDTGLGEELRTRIKEGADVVHDRFHNGGSLELLPENLRGNLRRSNLGDALSNMRVSRLFYNNIESEAEEEEVATAAPAPPPPPPTVAAEGYKPLLFPWFRPGRFLQRVQQAIH